MASRRNLKKTINFVSSELITDIYFHCLMKKELNEEKVDQLVLAVVKLTREFVLRANRPDGKENPTVVKTYFRKLYADWQVEMDKVVKEMSSL